MILTAGGIDAHVHFICSQLADEAIASGLTTMLGGGTGPATGTCATTVSWIFSSSFVQNHLCRSNSRLCFSVPRNKSVHHHQSTSK